MLIPFRYTIYKYSTLATIISFLGPVVLITSFFFMIKENEYVGFIGLILGLIMIIISFPLGKKLNKKALRKKIKSNLIFCEMLVESNPNYKELCVELNEEYRNHIIQMDEDFTQDSINQKFDIKDKCVYCGRSTLVNQDYLCHNCFDKMSVM